MAQDTLYTLAQRNESDSTVGLIEDVTTYSPEFFQVPAIARAGTTYRTLSRTGLPQAQFRTANQAITSSASTYAQRVHQMFYLDVPIIVDEMVYEGDDGVTGDLLYQEGQGGLQSAINLISTQFWYGQANDGSNGYVGMRAQLLPVGGAVTTPVTASNSATSSTAYLLWMGPQGVNFAVGKYGEIAFPAFQRQFITAKSNPDTAGVGTPAGYHAWVTNIKSWIGVSVGSINSVFGVTGCNNSNAPLTDKLALNLIAQVPLARRSGLTWFMNPTVHAGLQASRTSINYQPASPVNATPAWSGPPMSLEGKPIILTNGITNTENNN